MLFVPVKAPEQQAVLALHRIRQGFIKQRTAQANQNRGLLGEFGIIIPQGITQILRKLPDILEDADNRLPALFRQQLSLLQDYLDHLFKITATLDKQIEQCHQQNALCQCIGKIPGIDPITASALVASIGNASNFKNGRQLAAWLGLVPRQHSCSGKQTLQGISKRGDSYLRTLLIHGARGVLRVAERKEQFAGSWLAGGDWTAQPQPGGGSTANKTARIVWALLAHDRKYDAKYGVAA